MFYRNKITIEKMKSGHLNVERGLSAVVASCPSTRDSKNLIVILSNYLDHSRNPFIRAVSRQETCSQLPSTSTGLHVSYSQAKALLREKPHSHLIEESQKTAKYPNYAIDDGYTISSAPKRLDLACSSR